MMPRSVVVVRPTQRPLVMLTISLLLLLLLLAAPLAAEAQQPIKTYRIGYLGSTAPSEYARQVEALRQGLRDLGYVEGKNLVIEYRWAEGSTSDSPTSRRTSSA